MHSQVHPFVSHGPQDELLLLEGLLSTELAPLESSTATHVHWPAHASGLEDGDGLGGGLLEGSELGSLDALESLDGGLLDGDGDDDELDGDELDGDGLDDGELDGGLLEGEDEGTLELLLDPQSHTSTQEVPAAATLQSWPP